MSELKDGLIDEVDLVGPDDKKQAKLVVIRQLITPKQEEHSPPNFTKGREGGPPLPIVLAGPILRRCTDREVCVWLAFSVPVALTGTIVQEAVITPDGKPKVVGFKNDIPVKQFGERLFIALARISPLPPLVTWPQGSFLSYSFKVRLREAESKRFKFRGDVLLFAKDVCYGDLPNFFFPESPGLRFAHGSCRKLHGPGFDAIRQIDAHFKEKGNGQVENFKNPAKRLMALFLTGDQIYADDVDPELIKVIPDLAKELMGTDNTRHVLKNKGQGSIGNIRKFAVKDAGFTSGHADHHLISFGEYAATYLLAWSPDLWDWRGLKFFVDFPNAKERIRTSRTIRRILANVPTYMIFDDHEVTDDWNLTRRWVDETNGPTKDGPGRHIVANGLAAFWLFQAMGNDPSSRTLAPEPIIQEFVQKPRPSQTEIFKFTKFMIDEFHEWHFSTPTVFPAFFLDTRTERSLPVAPAGSQAAKAGLPPGLMQFAALQRLSASIPPGSNPDDPDSATPQQKALDSNPVIIVSPAPVIGWEEIESVQAEVIKNIPQSFGPKKLVERIEDVDGEAWSLNHKAFSDFLHALGATNRKRFLILSGDVHYGFTAVATVLTRLGGVLGIKKKYEIIQLTSSATKNQVDAFATPGFWMSGIIDLADVLKDKDIHHVVGRQVQDRYIITDIPSTGLPDNWDLQLKWRYLPLPSDEEPDPLNVVAPNNVGIVEMFTEGLDTALHSSALPNIQQRIGITWNSIQNLVPLIVGP